MFAIRITEVRMKTNASYQESFSRVSTTLVNKILNAIFKMEEVLSPFIAEETQCFLSGAGMKTPFQHLICPNRHVDVWDRRDHK